VGKLCLRYARSAHSHETRLHARLYDALNTLGVLGADGLEPGHTIHTAGPALHGATLAGHHGNAGLGAEASGIKCDSALGRAFLFLRAFLRLIYLLQLVNPLFISLDARERLS
jgi:hypothetical protein